jgi:hypothetical protein
MNFSGVRNLYFDEMAMQGGNMYTAISHQSFSTDKLCWIAQTAFILRSNWCRGVFGSVNRAR